MFVITNQISGKTFEIKDSQSILAAGLSQGIAMPYGCEKGFCGKCKGLVLAGEILHTNPLPKGIEQSEFDEGFALMCQSQALSDVSIAVDELSSTAEIESKIYPAKVVSIDKLSFDVIALKLKTPVSDTMQFLAGQYIDLLHNDFEPRSFSIANSPNIEGIIELHIRLIDDGKFTQFVFNELQEKSLLQLEGPKGSFYLRDGDKPIVMLAGGTGFGPIKSMVESMLGNQSRSIVIYWGARDEQGLYSDLPKQWAAEYDHISYVPVLSEQTENWAGRTGFVHQAVLTDYPDLSAVEVYACGAPIMVKAAADSFATQGLPKTNFYSDAFEFQVPTQ